jgi:hypothetical protein
MNRRTLFSIAFTFLCVSLLVVWTAGLHHDHSWTFRFTEMPPTDDELLGWLRAQSGVERPEVWRQEGVLCLHYRIRFWRMGPNIGDFTSPFEWFGYKGFTKSTMRQNAGWGW